MNIMSQETCHFIFILNNKTRIVG